LPTALEIARDVAVNAAPVSVAVSKKLLWESFDLTPQQVERAETELHHHIMGAPDAIEGPTAYFEKRAPKWSMRVSSDWPSAWPNSDEPDESEDT
jgi:enoyl-CoA hydratase/carnithine racemase